MTDTKTALSATDSLFRIMKELAEAQKDVAQLERLSTAKERVTRLTAEQANAVIDQDAELAQEAATIEAARFSGFSSIEVLDRDPADSVMHSRFAITYTRDTYDMNYRENLPKAVTVQGFLGLDDLTFDYLVEKQPSKIPSKIMVLAPGNPRAAFERYFQGKRRGYLSGSLV